MTARQAEPRCDSIPLQCLFCLHKEKHHIFTNTHTAQQSGNSSPSSEAGEETDLHHWTGHSELVVVRKKGSLHINKPAAVTAMAFGTMGFQQRAAQQLWWLMSFGLFLMLRDAGFHILN